MSDTKVRMPDVCLRPYVLVCYGCITMLKHSYLVLVTDDLTARLEYAREHARREYGWSCDCWGDFCQACVQRREDT